MNTLEVKTFVSMCVCVHVCATLLVHRRARTCVCVRTSLCARVHVYVCELVR